MVTLDQLLDSDRLDRITVEARQVRAGRALLILFAAVLYGVGWVTARGFGALWLAAAWTFTAVRLGWQEGRKQHRSEPTGRR